MEPRWLINAAAKMVVAALSGAILTRTFLTAYNTGGLHSGRWRRPERSCGRGRVGASSAHCAARVGALQRSMST